VPNQVRVRDDERIQLFLPVQDRLERDAFLQVLLRRLVELLENSYRNIYCQHLTPAPSLH
jgi:hypothetical protein